MTDITRGAFRQCIEAASRNPGRNELGLRISPLMQRKMSARQSSNPNSRYDHYRRISVGFLPLPGSKPGDGDALYRSRDQK